MPDSPFAPVRTAADLLTLDHNEIVRGYMDYEPGDPEPGANQGRAYWHGWCNARTDRTTHEPTEAQRALVREIAPRGKMMTRAEMAGLVDSREDTNP